MAQAKAGDTVRVHYHGKLTDGTTFDSSAGKDPLEFTVGKGMVIPGFDNAIPGMETGEKKTVNIPVEDAYGPANDEYKIEVPRTDFPPDVDPEPGMELQMSDDDGNVFPVTVAELREETVLLDANHHLAGKDLVFDIELVEIL